MRLQMDDGSNGVSVLLSRCCFYRCLAIAKLERGVPSSFQKKLICQAFKGRNPVAEPITRQKHHQNIDTDILELIKLLTSILKTSKKFDN